MFKQLPSLHKLVHKLQRVPYLASKNIYKVATYFFSCKQEELQQLCQAILDAKKNVKSCCSCFNWTEGGQLCSICSSQKRDKTIICVVETWHDLFAIEKVGDYQGVYHVLGGALCPLEGIGPEDLQIEPLLKRVNKFTKEIIFATNPTPGGEATASFISSKLEEMSFVFSISKLASGVPIGSTLEYMDRVTIHKALSGRTPF